MFLDVLSLTIITILIIRGGYRSHYDTFTNGLLRSNNLKYRNLAAIFIVLHHGASAFFNNNILIAAFNNIGHLVVGLFFLWSGWGLGLKTQSDEFDIKIKNFIKESIVPLFLYTFAFNLLKVGIFTTGKAIENKYASYSTVLKQIFLINLPDTTEWYLIVLLMVYILYWATESAFKKRNLKTCIYAMVFSLYIISCWCMGVEGHWYISVITWFVGYSFALYQDFWKMVLDVHWFIGSMICFAFWLATWLFVVVSGKGSLDITSLTAMLLTELSVICFGILITYLDAVFSLSDIWSKRGDFSLGMYVLHPIILLGVSYMANRGVPKALCMIVAFIILIPLSYPASSFYKIVKSKL